MLRDLMAHPTLFVSKDQATITLARYLMAQEAGGSAQAAGSAAQPARPVGQVALSIVRRTAAAVGGRSRHAGAPAVSGGAEPGAAYTRNPRILTATPSSATATG